MKTMLIVDDSAYGRTLINVAVSKIGIKVVGEAENGKEGVEKYIQLSPDIVTLDLAMNEMDGIEALKQIMQHNPNAYVIIISSIAGQEVVAEEALSLGAKKIFDKPFRGDVFEIYAREENLI